MPQFRWPSQGTQLKRPRPTIWPDKPLVPAGDEAQARGHFQAVLEAEPQGYYRRWAESALVA